MTAPKNGDIGHQSEQRGPFKTLDLTLLPDPTRTVIRAFEPSYPASWPEKDPIARSLGVAKRVLAEGPVQTEKLARDLLASMGACHRNTEATFRRRYAELPERVRALGADLDEQLLLGATFCQEYAFESAALFNPSIIADPLRESAPGETNFIMSLRGVGEGHISSVTLRTGTWKGDGSVVVDPPSRFAVPPLVTRQADRAALLVAEDSQDVSETVIFPMLPSQRQGVEDLRMVVFVDDDGSREVIGTYTAFDGRDARPELMHGLDFRTVEMRTLSGRFAQGKGMALFPRRIDGQYAMLGRQDNERIWLLRSDDLYHWDQGEPILAPRYPWEWIQLGNCGSPVEVEEGWLVLIHGVGPLRVYCIGACLLDRDDPSRVLARTPRPLIVPGAEHRGGYVPNVTYTCGMLKRGRELLVPYAVGDRFTTFATGSLDAVLEAMEPV